VCSSDLFIILFVMRPFFERQHIHSLGSSQELSSLLAERERLLTALQELDSDQALGKIPNEDYPNQRTELLQKGAEVLRKIDTLSPDTLKEPAGKEFHLVTPSQTPVPLSDDDLEELLARRRNLRKERTAGFCPKCGKPVSISDAYCPACGHALKEG
jgi:rubrerythrin